MIFLVWYWIIIKNGLARFGKKSGYPKELEKNRQTFFLVAPDPPLKGRESGAFFVHLPPGLKTQKGAFFVLLLKSEWLTNCLVESNFIEYHERFMDELCIASSNPGKLAEIQALLSDFRIKIHSQDFFDIKPAPETGHTFVENAIIKARHAAQLSKLPTIADDSGLCIDRLNQAPGINSSSYAGERATATENIQKVTSDIGFLQHSPVNNAQMVTVICFMRNVADQTPLIITEFLRGEVLLEPRGQTRGYDSIFFLPELGKTLGELSIPEKNKISPRGRAIIKLRQFFKKNRNKI